ncbi:GtrA family protein [Parasphingorhabdus sp.]|uniref:GtrA family protein n=1 Tax=Parasphingorhabdus sp. TaxID=2709688 RepID=UPI0032672D56
MERSGIDRRSTIGTWVGSLPASLAILNRFAITRYLLASVMSLAFDVALFMILVAFLFDPAWASAAGYSAGIVVHWFISSNFVFPGKLRDGTALQLQRFGFICTAILGLGITVTIVSGLVAAGILPVVAKGAAVVVSFFAVYLTRKYGVFR